VGKRGTGPRRSNNGSWHRGKKRAVTKRDARERVVEGGPVENPGCRRAVRGSYGEPRETGRGPRKSPGRVIEAGDYSPYGVLKGGCEFL